MENLKFIDNEYYLISNDILEINKLFIEKDIINTFCDGMICSPSMKKILASTKNIGVELFSIKENSWIVDYYSKYNKLPIIDYDTDIYYDIKIGDKLKVKTELHGLSLGTIITVRGFNELHDSILYEGGDDLGVHRSHLEYDTYKILRLTDNKLIFRLKTSIDLKKESEKYDDMVDFVKSSIVKQYWFEQFNL